MEGLRKFCGDTFEFFVSNSSLRYAHGRPGGRAARIRAERIPREQNSLSRWSPQSQSPLYKTPAAQVSTTELTKWWVTRDRWLFLAPILCRWRVMNAISRWNATHMTNIQIGKMNLCKYYWGKPDTFPCFLCKLKLSAFSPLPLWTRRQEDCYLSVNCI